MWYDFAVEMSIPPLRAPEMECVQLEIEIDAFRALVLHFECGRSIGFETQFSCLPTDWAE